MRMEIDRKLLKHWKAIQTFSCNMALLGSEPYRNERRASTAERRSWAECVGLPDSVGAWNAKNRSFLRSARRESHHRLSVGVLLLPSRNTYFS
jgi:hypothetical protein